MTLKWQPKQPSSKSYLACVPAFKDGTDSPRHFFERCLEVLARLETDVKAFSTIDCEAARRSADDASVRYRAGRTVSTIDGMPIAVKDIIFTRHLPTQMGSPIYDGFQPRRDAACIIALRKAGAYVLGKTVTAEFACGRSGPTRNPFDLSRTPGGTSSGSAAAVGSGMAPAALGTQTQASLIRPASYCGAYAIKPSRGLLLLDGIAPLSPTLDHLGVFGATLEDAWGVLAPIAALGHSLNHPPINLPATLPPATQPRNLVRLETKGWDETDNESKRALDTALKQLAKVGVHIYDRKHSTAIAELEEHISAASDASPIIYAYEAQWPLRSYVECGEGMAGERVREMVSIADRLTPEAYRDALEKRRRLRERLNTVDTDGFVTLSSSGPAIQDISYTGSRSFAVPWTTAGVPSISLPLLASAGLPLGLQVVGAERKDVATVGFAAWIDRCLQRSMADPADVGTQTRAQ